MLQLVTTNDVVTISLIEALLKESEIQFFIFDQHMSVLEGSIGAIPRRIMVSDEDFERAAQLLRDAELGHLVSERKSG